ncbi:putative head protein/prohead protease, partial [Escherichia coli 5412]
RRQYHAVPGGAGFHVPDRQRGHPCGALDQLASSPYCGGGGDHRSELRQCVRRLSLIRRTGGVRLP